MEKVTLNITGMHCSSCAKIIKIELDEQLGVSRVEVNYDKHQAVITYDPTKNKVNNFIKIINDLSYQAKEA